MTNHAHSPCPIRPSRHAVVCGVLIIVLTIVAACEKSNDAGGQSAAAPRPSIVADPNDVSVPYGEDEDTVIVRYRRTKSGKVVADTVRTGPSFEDITVRTADAKLKLPYNP